MEPAFADDVLCGADEIAAFLFGDAKQRRRVFYLVERSRLPVFRMGATICMRRSTWFEWVKRQEAKASGSSDRDRPPQKPAPSGDKGTSGDEPPADGR